MTQSATSAHTQANTTEPAFWRLLEEGFDYKPPERGAFVSGTIVAIQPEWVAVDIGVKRDGLVPASDLKKLDEGVVDNLKMGDEVFVCVEHTWTREGDLILSMARAREMEDWNRAEELLNQDRIIELEVHSINRGGLIVPFGLLRGFVPTSHVDGISRGFTAEERMEAMAALVGEVLPVKVIEVSLNQRRLILSHREAARAYRDARMDELLQTLSAGDVITGKVSSVANFGVFVDVGGASGLVHVSEISHDKVRNPRDFFEAGQEVEVYVLRVDQERKRIDLSMKRLQQDPWETMHSRYWPGQILPVTVTNVVRFGAFAELEPGLEGLIHVSRISRDYISHPGDRLSPGDAIMVRIQDIDLERRRISLTMQDVPQWVEAADPSVEPEPAEAGGDESEGARSNGVHPVGADGIRPDGIQPDGIRSDGIQPDAIEPEGAQAEGVH